MSLITNWSDAYRVTVRSATSQSASVRQVGNGTQIDFIMNWTSNPAYWDVIRQHFLKPGELSQGRAQTSVNWGSGDNSEVLNPADINY